MSNPATKRAARILKAVGSQAQDWGHVQKIWNTRTTPQEKRNLLLQYCHVSNTQMQLALPLPWSILSLHIRKSLKRYFRDHGEGHPLFPEGAKKVRKK